MIVFLSKPPSVNGLFPTNNGRRVKSRGYQAWIDAMKPTLIAQRVRPIHGPVALAFTFPDAGNVDLSNHLKAAEDILVRFGLIDGDSRKIVRRITLDWGSVPPFMGVEMGAMIEVTPWG